MARNNNRQRRAIGDTEPLPLEVLMEGATSARRWQTANRNTGSFDYWLHRLRTLAISSFEWINLPDTIDPRFVELCMLDYGMGGFFDMSSVGEGGIGNYAFAQATPVNRLNLYWNPNRVRFIPANGGGGWIRNAYYWTLAHNEQLTVMRPDSVVMFDNMNRKSILPILMVFARRLANIDGKIDVNINGQSTPYLIEVPEQSRRDAINIYKQLAGNEPVIIANRGASSILDIKVQPTVAPYVADKLLADQRKIFHLALSMLGIDNTNVEKRERMLTNEVESNDEEIMLMRRSRLFNRQQFCNAVNDRFGLDIQVRYWAGDSESWDDREEIENEQAQNIAEDVERNENETADTDPA